MLNICDIVMYKGEQYRVDFFCQKVYWEPKEKSNDPLEQLIDQVVDSMSLKEWYRRQEKNLPSSKTYKYKYCSREEATHVDLYGLQSVTVPINECTFVRVVDWSPEFIKEQQERNQRMIDAQNKNMLMIDWMWE